MVELHDGKISVESELGQGILFKVSLPVKQLDESEVEKLTKHKEKGNIIRQIDIEFSDIYSK